jgi:hypothetical protein
VGFSELGSVDVGRVFVVCFQPLSGVILRRDVFSCV